MQLVQNSIKWILLKGIEINAENIIQSGAADPIRHRMLGGRCDQSIECHGAGELAHRLCQSELFQDGIETKTLPELVAYMDRPGFTMTFGGDAGGVNTDQSVFTRTLWSLFFGLLL